MLRQQLPGGKGAPGSKEFAEIDENDREAEKSVPRTMVF